MSVIETPLGFLDVGKEAFKADAAQPSQMVFGVTPERFNAIDMATRPIRNLGKTH